MPYGERWDIVKELGKGGQGQVHLVLDKLGLKKEHYLEKLYEALKDIQIPTDQSRIAKRSAEEIWTTIREMVQVESEEPFGALKILNKPDDARDAERASERAENEIIALKQVSHPNLISILDDSMQEGWLVSKYYRRGNLLRNSNMFRGNALTSLRAFRALVDGVVHLHEQSLIHRDIKPENLLVSGEGDLVLCDFGLTFFVDDEATRLSATGENVGSRDWMPQWAMGRRIDDVRSTFDVYSLGKVLWSMISGKSFLNLWFFRKDEYDLVQQYPDQAEMRLINDLLGKCIVQEEEDCLPSADALLRKIDFLIPMLEQGADLLSKNVTRRCKVCGDGRYVLVTDGGVDQTNNFGLNVVGEQRFKIFTCVYCGHVQLFSQKGDVDPPAWKDS